VQLVTNQAYVRGRERVMKRYTLLGVPLFFVAFVPLFLQEFLWLFYPVFLLLFFATTVTKQLQFQWAPGMRADERIARVLKGLNARYWLGNYVPFGRDIVPHVLVGSEGVLALVARNHSGDIACAGGKWRRRSSIFGRIFGRQPALGDPGRELQATVALLRSELDAAGFPDVPVSGAVVFTALDVNLTLDECSATALTLKQLESWAATRRASQGPLDDATRLKVTDFFASRIPGAEPAWRDRQVSGAKR
jgi:hypothetical protein